MCNLTRGIVSDYSLYDNMPNLLTLPLEVRTLIYDFYLDELVLNIRQGPRSTGATSWRSEFGWLYENPYEEDPCEDDSCEDDPHKKLTHLALTQVCRQVRTEFVPRVAPRAQLDFSPLFIDR